MIDTQDITAALHAEIERTPAQHRALLRLVHSFREGVEQEIEDVDPQDSLRQALDKVRAGDTRSVEGLWDRAGLRPGASKRRQSLSAI